MKTKYTPKERYILKLAKELAEQEIYLLPGENFPPEDHERVKKVREIERKLRAVGAIDWIGEYIIENDDLADEIAKLY